MGEALGGSSCTVLSRAGAEGGGSFIPLGETELVRLDGEGGAFELGVSNLELLVLAGEPLDFLLLRVCVAGILEDLVVQLGVGQT